MVPGCPHLAQHIAHAWHDGHKHRQWLAQQGMTIETYCVEYSTEARCFGLMASCGTHNQNDSSAFDVLRPPLAKRPWLGRQPPAQPLPLLAAEWEALEQQSREIMALLLQATTIKTQMKRLGLDTSACDALEDYLKTRVRQIGTKYEPLKQSGGHAIGFISWRSVLARFERELLPKIQHEELWMRARSRRANG